MDAINVLGAIGQGVVNADEINMKRDAMKQEQAIKGYQLKKLADEQAADERWLPVDKVFPNHREMKETFKFMTDTANEYGWGDGIRQSGDMYMIKQKAAKQLMATIALSTDLQKKMLEKTSMDLQNKYSSLYQIVNTGMDREGKKLKPEDLEKAKAELNGVTYAIAGAAQAMDQLDPKARIERIKAEAKMAEKEFFGRTKSGENIMIDKGGKLYLNNQPYTGDPSQIITKSELTTHRESHNTGSVTSTSTVYAPDRMSDTEKAFRSTSPEFRKKNNIENYSDYLVWYNKQNAIDKAAAKPQSGGIPINISGPSKFKK